jgi:acetyltransferase-like isoleucine patch superfamily enzyme
MMRALRRRFAHLLGRSNDPRDTDPERNVSTSGGELETGHGTQIHQSSRVHSARFARIGAHVWVGPGVQVFARGGVTIDDHCMIGPEAVILTLMHNYRDPTMVPYDEVVLMRPVRIGRCTWIGMRAIVLPGVQLGEGTVVGAGAVVTRSFPPGSIVAGNPAKVIGTRNMEVYSRCVSEGRFYFMHKNVANLDPVYVLDDRPVAGEVSVSTGGGNDGWPA